MSTEEEKIAELLKPRYKVIADYPMSSVDVGEVLIPDKETNQCVTQGGYWGTDLTKYPHLFRKMDWHEDRLVGDMPKYLKCIKTPDQIHQPNTVYKIDWVNKYYGKSELGQIIVSTNCYLPATELEYTTYQSSIKQ